MELPFTSFRTVALIFNGNAVADWLDQSGVTIHHIKLGGHLQRTRTTSPDFDELMDEFLNEEIGYRLKETNTLIECR